MQRFALKIEYHGAPFFGWQRQTRHPSVQQAVEDALRRIDPVCTGVAAAGRTDAGVHATGQVAHCDLTRNWDPFRLAEAVNFHLKPAPIAILAAAAVAPDWHARFSAVQRRYLFRILCRRPQVTHEAGLVWQVRTPLDAAAMQTAANRLIGHHDFTTFRSTLCQAKSPMKTMDEIRIEEIARPDGQEIRLHFLSRSFLHNQVRSITGTLERVGAGAWTANDVTAALHARDRTACGTVCPPDGLYLAEVRYATDPFAPA